MSHRHRIYDDIQRLLADGEWHDSRELERVTSFTAPWLLELRHDPHVEIRDESDRTVLRRRAPVGIAGHAG